MKLINNFRNKDNCDRLARISNEEIIDRIYHSDENVFNDLYHCSMDVVIGFIRKKSKYIADDDVSEMYHVVFITFCENIKNRKLTSLKEAKPTTYMVSIAHKLLIQGFREKSKGLLLEYSEIEFERDLKLADQSERDSENRINLGMRFDLFYEALNLIDDRCERIISAYHFEKLSMTQIADELELKSADVAKVKKSKCIAKLKELVKKLQDGRL